MKSVLLAGLFFTGVAHAAGGGGTVWDLKWPLVNFILLFSFLVWKIRKPLRAVFDKNAEEVKQIYELAKEKDKEARIKLEMYKKKIENLNGECEAILKEGKRRQAGFSEEHAKEVNQLIERLKKDAAGKIEFEKQCMVGNLNKLLVDKIVDRTKEVVGESGELRRKATMGLLAQVK